MVLIPFTVYPSITKEVTFDERGYKLLFTWNTRMEAWTLSFLELDDTPILSGIKLVLNYELISIYRHLDIPQGNLYVIDLSNNEEKIDYNDFSNERRLSLAYYEEGELESISA